MRTRFDEQLSLLNRELTEMGALCEAAISGACRGLLNFAERDGAEVSELEAEIDHKERDIESLCLKLLLQQQPVASDLRQISAALKMITDMERIGDMACDISDMTAELGQVDGDFGPIDEMAAATMSMVTESVDAFVRRDVGMATAVIARDDKVDELFERVKAKLIEKIADDKHDSEQAVDILLIAKYFERIGDHAENVAEWVSFSVTGIHKGEVEL